MSLPTFPSLIIGDVTVVPIKRLPSSAFTATPIQARSVVRAEDGTLHVTDKFTKHIIGISGLAQDTIEDLRFEYEKPETIELHSIVPRRERFSPAGLTSQFTLSRQTRLDQPVAVQFPIGTFVTVSLVVAGNSGSFGTIDVGFTPPAGTNTLLIDYYPIFVGVISNMTSEYSWVDDEESWDLVFDEV
jgi:hypothetical protein